MSVTLAQAAEVLRASLIAISGSGEKTVDADKAESTLAGLALLEVEANYPGVDPDEYVQGYSDEDLRGLAADHILRIMGPAYDRWDAHLTWLAQQQQQQ